MLYTTPWTVDIWYNYSIKPQRTDQNAANCIGAGLSVDSLLNSMTSNYTQ